MVVQEKIKVLDSNISEQISSQEQYLSFNETGQSVDLLE